MEKQHREEGALDDLLDRVVAIETLFSHPTVRHDYELMEAGDDEQYDDESSNRTAIEYARDILALRRKRDRLFRLRPASRRLFGEPVWDMLLDLYISDTEGRKVSVSSLCIASAGPPTTALRAIKTLIYEGYIDRKDDPEDGRRIWVSLTPKCRELLTDLLRSSSRM